VGESVGSVGGVSREELTQLVKALKDAVVELREAVNELSNPLTQLTSSEGVSEGSKAEGVKPAVIQAMPPKQLETPSVDEGASARDVSGLNVEPSVKEGLTVKSEGRVKPKVRFTGLREVIKFMRLVDVLIEKTDKSVVSNYLKLLSKVGVIDPESLDIALTLVDVVDESRRKGLTTDEQILLLEALVSGVGRRDASVDDEVLTYAVKELLSRRDSSDSGRG